MKLMIVEDHADSARALSKLLQAYGHHTEVADCCRQAMQLFTGSEYDFILCDLGLPDGDGCELLREMLMIRSQPAIALTGFGMTDDITRSKVAGFISHVTKPIDMEKLLGLLAGLRANPETFPLAEHVDIPPKSAQQ
jgi:CheY-like chemotaxis protein